MWSRLGLNTWCNENFVKLAAKIWLVLCISQQSFSGSNLSACTASHHTILVKQKNSNHVCTYCQKIFDRPSLLERHIRSHTGEKPFPCPHCNYRASYRGNLNRHVIHVHQIMEPHQQLHGVINSLSLTKQSVDGIIMKSDHHVNTAFNDET